MMPAFFVLHLVLKAADADGPLQSILIRERFIALYDPLYPSIEALWHIVAKEQLLDRLRKIKKREQVGFPGKLFRQFGIFPGPCLAECSHALFRLLPGICSIDPLQFIRYRSFVGCPHFMPGVALKMYPAGLMPSSWKDIRHSIGKPDQSVADKDGHLLEASGLKSLQHLLKVAGGLGGVMMSKCAYTMMD